MASSKRKKLTDTDTDSDNNETRQTDYWPSWLVIRASQDEKPLSSLHPFAIKRGILGLAGKPKTYKKMKDGLLVECATRKHSELLLKSKTLVSVPISVTPHKTLNSTKGVIRCRDLRNMPEEEIQTELASQGVTEVHRVTIRKGSERAPTDTYFLTFNKTSLPEDIEVGFEKVRVSLYVPSPMRCFKCQKFGHTRMRCSEEEVCGVCCKAKHEGACAQPALCANCGGKHPSSSKECPMWLQEKEIQRVKTTDRISFRDAKKKVLSRQPQAAGPHTYAAVAKKTFASIACQTAISSVTESQKVQNIRTLQGKNAPGGGVKPATPTAPGGGSKPTTSPAKQGKKPAPSPRSKEGQGPQNSSGTKGDKQVVMPEKVAATKVQQEPKPKHTPASSRLKKAERNGTHFYSLMESDDELEVDIDKT